MIRFEADMLRTRQGVGLNLTGEASIVILAILPTTDEILSC